MTRTSSRRARVLPLVAALAAGLALIPVAAEAQEGTSRLLLELDFTYTSRRDFQGDLQQNCSYLLWNGLSPNVVGDPVRGAGAATGTLNFGSGTGEAFMKRGATWEVKSLSGARPTVFGELGIALDGSNVFLTARVTRGRRNRLGARRERLALLRGVKIDSGPLTGRDRQPVPNTFSSIVKGRLTVLPALSRALERTRCKKSRENRSSRRLKPGYPLGTLGVGYRPSEASGLAGDALIRARVSPVEDDDQVTVQPGAGVKFDGEDNLVAPITTGLPVPLTCTDGESCRPGGGSFGLGGGFDLVFRDRRASVGNLAVTTTGTPPSSLRQSITGTLDGAPVTVADGAGDGEPLALTDDFRQRAGAALGVEVTGSLGVSGRFTRTEER